jgi:hypothetical protein
VAILEQRLEIKKKPPSFSTNDDQINSSVSPMCLAKSLLIVAYLGAGEKGL